MKIEQNEVLGKTILRFTLDDGRPFWSARQVALAIGYESGSGLADAIMAEGGERPADVAELGHEMAVAVGLAIHGRETSASRVLALYESGLRIALRRFAKSPRHANRATFLRAMLGEEAVAVAPEPVPVEQTAALVPVVAASADDMHPSLSAMFEGHPLTVLTYKGQPVWIAREIGRALGYEGDGAGFTKGLREWADELGDRLLKVEGADWSALREMIGEESGEVGEEKSPTSPSPFSPSALLLTESGVLLALTKTSKPAGKRLRAWLADEVLPAIRRTGTYILPTGPAKPLAVGEANEARALGIQAAGIIERLIARLPADSMQYRHLSVLAAEQACGQSLQHLLPAMANPDRSALEYSVGEGLEPEGESMTATELARYLGVSPATIGHVRKAVGLIGTRPGLCIEVLDAKGTGYPTVRYFPRGRQMIADAAFKSRAIHRPVDVAELLLLKRQGRLVCEENRQGHLQYMQPAQMWMWK